MKDKKTNDPCGIKEVYKEVCDGLITDKILMEDARWKIGRNLTALEDETLPEDLLSRCYLLPRDFEFSVKAKLSRSGIKWVDHCLSDILGSGIKEDIKSCLLALHEIKQLDELLMKNGVVDREAAMIYFHTFELFLSLFRAGLVEEKVLRGESFSNTQSQKGSKPRSRNGFSPVDRAKRNQKMIDHFKKASEKGNISMNGFAKKYEKKYGLKQAAIRQILKNNSAT